MSEDEMRQLWRDGEPMAYIASKAYRQNGLSRAEVRAIIHGGAK